MKECLFGNPIHNKKRGTPALPSEFVPLFFMMIESIKTFSTPEQTKPRQLLVLEGFDTAQSQELLTLPHP